MEDDGGIRIPGFSPLITPTPPVGGNREASVFLRNLRPNVAIFNSRELSLWADVGVDETIRGMQVL